MKRVVILGGGTFNPIRNHLSLAAPAFGTTARKIHKLIPNSELILTKMADHTSKYRSNKDIESLIDDLLLDDNLGTIIMNVALCDFETKIGNIESGFNSERLKTANGNINIELSPSNKIISKIRVERPDIFLVGFKTTTNETTEDQFSIALKMMKKTKCNLVLANDTSNRRNMIITPEESTYSITTDRDEVLKELCSMIMSRNNLTYNRTNFIKEESRSINNTSKNFQEVLKFVIDNGGYIENNGNGFTPGHFCQKVGKSSFLSSQRKADHNKVFDEGLTLVEVEGDVFTAKGLRKPSVGARSQWLLLQEYPEYDCIIHTHNPQKEESLISKVEQKPFQCGSLECGLNTMNNIKDYDGIKAIFLEKHGVNILFKSSEDPEKIKEFIKNNIELGTKIGIS